LFVLCFLGFFKKDLKKYKKTLGNDLWCEKKINNLFCLYFFVCCVRLITDAFCRIKHVSGSKELSHCFWDNVD